MHDSDSIMPARYRIKTLRALVKKPLAAQTSGGMIVVRGAMRCWPVRHRKIVGAVDERDVREGLRKIAQLAFETRVVFLGQQANVVAQSKQPLEETMRVFVTAHRFQTVDQPERAR